MKTIHKILTVCSVGVLLSAGLGQAEAKDIRFSASTSGSFVSTTIDTNEDNTPGSLFSLEGKSRLGQVSVELLAEFAFGPPTAACPGAFLEGTVVTAQAVMRLQKRKGDLIFLESTSGSVCLAPDGTFSRENAPIDVMGGTGRFLNASGSLSADFDGVFLITDPALRSFGSVVSELTGTITIP